MSLILLVAFAADPIDPPKLDAESMQRIAAMEKRLAAVEAKLGLKAPDPLPKAKPAAPQPKGEPTYHYLKPANIRIENGAVVLDQVPTHVSYDGGPFWVPIEQAEPRVRNPPQATAPVVQPVPQPVIQPQAYYELPVRDEVRLLRWELNCVGGR